MSKLNFVLITLMILFISEIKSQTNAVFSKAIEDNSFLIEEAYNQEQGIVQHISNDIYRTKPSKDFLYSFTQEWPIRSVKHQLSYTIPFSFINENKINGLGDILINYRHQLLYKDDWACVSPRISLILPSGNSAKDLGLNTFGAQFNLPVSKRISNLWIVHLNAGFTFYPNVKGSDTLNNKVNRNLSYYNFGGSLIWLTGSKFNVMLECLENINSEFDYSGKVIYTNETIINPGLRAAIDIGNLQVLPGFSIPITFSES